MTEQRAKPVYGMRNELHARLQFLLMDMDEARAEVEAAQRRLSGALATFEAVISEDGPIFQRVRCESCRTSWVDERAQPKVTHCPSCGKEHK